MNAFGARRLDAATDCRVRRKFKRKKKRIENFVCPVRPNFSSHISKFRIAGCGGREKAMCTRHDLSTHRGRECLPFPKNITAYTTVPLVINFDNVHVTRREVRKKFASLLLHARIRTSLFDKGCQRRLGQTALFCLLGKRLSTGSRHIAPIVSKKIN